jgi:hypothetical protein
MQLYQSVWQPWILLKEATIALNMSMLGNSSILNAQQNSACGATSSVLEQNSSQEAAVGLQLVESRAVSFRLHQF